MSDILSFPGLGLEFELSRVAFSIGGIAIYWYGIIIAVAFLLGSSYALRRCKTFGLDQDRLMETIIAGAVLGVICARLYYVIFSGDSTYFENPARILNLREGGIAIYGGIIGALLAGLIMSKVRQIKLLPLFDVAAGGLILGQAIGRWGNFVNMEAFGSNTLLPWGMTSSTIQNYLAHHQVPLSRMGVIVDPEIPVHPTFLYESLWCFLGFAIIAWYSSRRRFDGEVALLYIGWYGLGRFFIEGLRTDSLLIGTLRVSQIVGLVCVAAAIITTMVVRSKIERANDPDFMPLYVNTEEGKAVVAGTFYPKKGETKTAEPAVTEAPAEAEKSDAEEAQTDPAAEQQEGEPPAETPAEQPETPEE